MRLLPFVLIVLLGCSTEEFRRNGRPGDSGYIAPNKVQVEVIVHSPELITETSSGPCIRQEYSVVESEDGTRYRVIGKVGPVGDKFKLDVSLLEEIGI